MIQASRLTYRVNQFWRALRTPTRALDVAQIRPYLSATQIALFLQMQPSEQWHAYSVKQRLTDESQDHPALLTAALLHDVGKILYPLLPIERAIIMLGQHFFPRQVSAWGKGEPRGLRRPFIVAERHAEWGADLAARAGAPVLTVNLIRRHQDVRRKSPILCRRPTREDRLLCALQSADDSN